MRKGFNLRGNGSVSSIDFAMNSILPLTVLLLVSLLRVEGQRQPSLPQCMSIVADTGEWVIVPPVYEGDTLYFLLDRNSPNIVFEEFYAFDSDRYPHYEWLLKSAECKYENESIEFAFYCFQRPKKKIGAHYCIERKPLSFLDSITYHDEHWLMYHDRSLLKMVNTFEMTGPVLAPKARILDKGTISNDSITMYEVILDWREPTQENDYIDGDLINADSIGQKSF